MRISDERVKKNAKKNNKIMCFCERGKNAYLFVKSLYFKQFSWKGSIK